MPAPERNRWLEWLEIGKARRESASINLREWWTAAKEEPELVWQTPAVRYTTYITGGLLMVLALRTAVDMFQPVNPAMMTPPAKTAYFDVICSNAACGRHFVIERKFSFHRFPVTCPFCKQPTGQRALRCPSATCHGRMTIVTEVQGQPTCQVCGIRRTRN